MINKEFIIFIPRESSKLWFNLIEILEWLMRLLYHVQLEPKTLS